MDEKEIFHVDEELCAINQMNYLKEIIKTTAEISKIISNICADCKKMEKDIEKNKEQIKTLKHEVYACKRMR